MSSSDWISPLQGFAISARFGPIVVMTGMKLSWQSVKQLGSRQRVDASTTIAEACACEAEVRAALGYCICSFTLPRHLPKDTYFADAMLPVHAPNAMDIPNWDAVWKNSFNANPKKRSGW